MEASITVFLHRGRQSAVTWPLRPNRISVLHCRLSCSTCSLSVGSVLHWMESMLCPGAVLQRWSRGSSGIFARFPTCIRYYCQSILKHTTLPSLFICVSAAKYNNCLLFALLTCIFVFFFISFLFFFCYSFGMWFCNMEEYIITCHFLMTLVQELHSLYSLLINCLFRATALQHYKCVMGYFFTSCWVSCGTCKRTLKLWKYCPINQKENSANT